MSSEVTSCQADSITVGRHGSVTLSVPEETKSWSSVEGKLLCNWKHLWQDLFLLLPRFIKKLEHSWKALVYDGVSSLKSDTALYEWAFCLHMHSHTESTVLMKKRKTFSFFSYSLAGLGLGAPARLLRQPLPQVHEHEGLQEDSA